MSSFTKQEERKNAFKNIANFRAATKRREEANLSLRKTNRERLLKRRREAPSDGSAPSTFPPPQEILSSIPLHATSLCSTDQQRVRASVAEFRKMLNFATNGVIEAVVAAGLVPRFVELLGCEDTEVQFESAWVLTNICTGTAAHVDAVVAAGCVPKMILLMNSTALHVVEQAIWALANIAGDSAERRDFVFECGMLSPLLKVLQRCNRPTIKRNAVWALLNLITPKPNLPPWQQISGILQVLSNLLHSQDDIVLLDTCLILSNVTRVTNEGGLLERIDCVLQANLLPRLIELLATATSAPVQLAVLGIIGNLVSGNDRQTQQVVNAGLLPILHSLLANPRRTVRKTTCWTISQICAGTSDQLEEILNADLLEPLVQCLQAEAAVQKDAAYAISNALAIATESQKKHMIEQGVVGPFCSLLTVPDPKVLQLALSGLQWMLKVGENEIANTGGFNVVAKLVQDCGGLDAIEKLQEHQSDEVYQHAVNVLEQFFDASEVEGAERDLMPPADTNANQFSFQAPEGSA